MSEASPVDAVIARISQVYRGWRRDTPVARMRDDWDALFASAPLDARIVPVAIGALNAEWVGAADARVDVAVLYLHGGGFQVGSTRSHCELMFSVAQASGCRVLGLDYRRAPEHRFPAALDDALAAFDWLLAQGFDERRVAIAGDSAGAGLAIAALLSLRRAGRAMPAAAVLLSAWTDLTASGASYASRADADPIHQRPMILAMARHYLGADGDARDPLASPFFADAAELAGLPPLLIQVGDRETVLSDSTLFADRARDAGVSVDLEVFSGMIHVFQQFPDELTEAREAIASIGRFLRQHLAPAPSMKATRTP